MTTGSTKGTTRRGRPGYDQEAVLRRAIALFNEQGYDATSVGDLARELGLTKSAIYHHVASKEHLLALALDEALDGLEAVLDEAATQAAKGDGGGDATAYERLRTVVRRSVEVLVDNLPAVTLLLRVRGNSEVEQQALDRRRHIDERLATLVEEAVAEGSVRSDVAPDLISRLLFGMVNSLTAWYRPGGLAEADVVADAVSAIAFEGLQRR